MRCISSPQVPRPLPSSVPSGPLVFPTLSPSAGLLQARASLGKREHDGLPRGHLPLSCPNPACACLCPPPQAASDAGRGLQRPEARRLLTQSEAWPASERKPCYILFRSRFCVGWNFVVGLNAGPPRKGPIYLYIFFKMAASSRAQVLDLYRAMLRESKHFSAYNYRWPVGRRGPGGPGCWLPGNVSEIGKSLFCACDLG